MKQHLSSPVGFLSTVFLALALAGCGSKREIATEITTDIPPAQVHVQKAECKSRSMTEEVVGTVRAKRHATLEAKLSGRIVKMPVALGDKIRKGQLVAYLEAAEIAARLDQARASLEEAQRDWKRTSALFEQQSATRSALDSAQARQQIAQGAVTEAKAMLEYVEILSPFDAVVAKKWADLGDLATPGKPLVDIEDPSALQLDADVPESIASHIQRDSRLRVRIDAIAGEFQGVVSEIAPTADPATRTFRVKLDLPRAAGLMAGQFGRLEVPIGGRASVRVSATAVVQRGQLEMVFSVTNQRARLHLVKTGRRVDDELEILSGIQAGDTVVISGAEQVTDGQPLEVK